MQPSTRLDRSSSGGICGRRRHPRPLPARRAALGDQDIRRALRPAWADGGMVPGPVARVPRRGGLWLAVRGLADEGWLTDAGKPFDGLMVGLATAAGQAPVPTPR